jgi:hypothetical protein
MMREFAIRLVSNEPTSGSSVLEHRGTTNGAGPIWTQIRPRLNRGCWERLGARLNWGLAMGIGHPPHNKQDRLDVLLRGADNVVPLRHRGDGFSDALSPLLEEALADEESTPQGIGNVLSLREENARLRALAVKLPNLAGDLPVREWKDAVAACADGPPMR